MPRWRGGCRAPAGLLLAVLLLAGSCSGDGDDSPADDSGTEESADTPTQTGVEGDSSDGTAGDDGSDGVEGEDGDGVEDGGPQPALTLTLAREATAEEVSATEEAVDARLAAAGIETTEVDVEGDQLLIGLASGVSGAQGDLIVSLLDTPGVLEARPVYFIAPAGTCEDPIAGIFPKLGPDGGLVSCYQLGEPILDNEAIDGAEAAVDTVAEEWAVRLTFTPEGIDSFNAFAPGCVANDPSCPTGQVAMVVDGVVLSAPEVIAASYERDEIQILGGDMDEQAARNLAAAISTPAMPIGLRL